MSPHRHPASPKHLKVGVGGKSTLLGAGIRRILEDPGGGECLEAPGGFAGSPRAAQAPGAAPRGFTAGLASEFWVLGACWDLFLWESRS